MSVLMFHFLVKKKFRGPLLKSFFLLFENFVGFSFSQNSCFGSDYFCSWPFDAVVVVVVFVAAAVVAVYVVVVGAAVDVVELIAEAVVDAVYAVFVTLI